MSAQLSVGASIAGRFEIRDLIEAAPGYTAYRAHDGASTVTLWWMRPELYPDEARRARFVQVAEILSEVEHPQVRRVLAAGREQDGLYAVVQPGSGGLRARLRRGAAPDEEIVWFASEIADALEAVHEVGLYHGRMVPADVVEHAGLVKLGAAGLFADVDVDAAAALWMRHERYVAPEVRRGAEPTPAADVYSLAVCLVELASGAIGAEIGQVAASVAERRPAIIGALAAGLASGPAQRPPSPRALADLVAEAAGTGPSGAGVRAAADDAAGGAAGGAQPEADAAEAADAPADEDAEDEPDAHATAQFGAARAPAPEAAAAEPAPPRELPLKEPDTEQPPQGPTRRRPPRPTPILPIGERGGKPPVIRSLSEFHQPPATGPLGNYAPPRTTPPAPRRRFRLVHALLAAIAAGATAALVWGLLQRFAGTGHEGGASAPASATVGAGRTAPGGGRAGFSDAAAAGGGNRADGGRAAATGAAPVCPPGMVFVPARRVCIDAFESPGKGQLPATGLDLGAARAACRRRGVRLCTGAEWEAACRGGGGADFPYGDTYRSEPCNSDPQRAGAVMVAGASPACVSAVGAYDMSGNVAEWTAGGTIKGGSALDKSDGRCDAARHPPRTDRGYPDVGFRCCATPRRR